MVKVNINSINFESYDIESQNIIFSIYYSTKEEIYKSLFSFTLKEKTLFHKVVLLIEDTVGEQIYVNNGKDTKKYLIDYIDGLLYKDENSTKFRSRLVSSFDFDNIENSLFNKSAQQKKELLIKDANNQIEIAEYDEAIRNLKKILYFEDNKDEIYLFISKVYFCKGDYEETIEILENAKISIDDFEHIYFYIFSYIYLEKLETAEYQLGLRFFDRKDHIYYNYFMAQIKYLKHDDYTAYLDKVHKIDKKFIKRQINENHWNFRFFNSFDPINSKAVSLYLNYKHPSSIVRKAREFKIPSYFDPNSGKYYFSKDEIDQFVKISNLYINITKKYDTNLEKLEDYVKNGMKISNIKKLFVNRNKSNRHVSEKQILLF